MVTSDLHVSSGIWGSPMSPITSLMSVAFKGEDEEGKLQTTAARVLYTQSRKEAPVERAEGGRGCTAVGRSRKVAHGAQGPPMAALGDDWVGVLGEPQRILSCLTFPICRYIRRVYVSITGARKVNTNLVLDKTGNRKRIHTQSQGALDWIMGAEPRVWSLQRVGHWPGDQEGSGKWVPVLKGLQHL